MVLNAYNLTAFSEYDSLWLQFPAVFQVLNPTVWETLLVHSFLNQLQMRKVRRASNFISFHVCRCNPFVGPLKLCRTPNEGMGRGGETRPNCDVQPTLNPLLQIFSYIGDIATLRQKIINLTALAHSSHRRLLGNPGMWER